MHELSICQALISQVEAVAVQNDASRVVIVEIQLGPLSGVVGELLQQAYTVASAGTIAEHSKLLIEHTPIRIHCESCGQDSDALSNRLVCAKCGDWKTRVISGDELILAHVELEKPVAEVSHLLH